jgi:DNA polymerase III subunit epsilon
MNRSFNIAAIDFETANENPSSVCALGIAVIENNVITTAKHWLIKPPEMRFNIFNTYLHNISEKKVEKKPEFYRIWPAVKKFIEGKIIIAHNASFDIGVLQSVLKVYQIDVPELYYACTVSLSRRVWKNLENYKLNTVAKSLEISFKHHNAKEDAFACASIAIEAAKNLNAKNFPELLDKIEMKLTKLA